jgi:microcystin-dependent protein
MALKNGRTTAALQTILVGSVIPAGSVAPFSGSVVPDGWLLCDGSAASRTTYSNLFAALGTAHGQGNGSTTFNLPDYRGQFLRGRVNISTVTGSGTAGSNQATFTAHGINRTGFRVRLSSGTLSGLAASTDYFAIVVDANTLAFASSQANALANTRIAISGANSGVITQWEDPDASTRLAPNVGGSSGNNVGSVQGDENKAHGHGSLFTMSSNAVGGTAAEGVARSNATSTIGGTNISNFVVATNGNESRSKNAIVNYIIKF